MKKLYRVTTHVGNGTVSTRTFDTPAEAGTFALTMLVLGLQSRCDEIAVDKRDITEN